MILFGSIYYIVPRLIGREWPSATLIKIHFWSVAIGIFLYFTGLSWGGWIQGELMNHSTTPFLEIVAELIPYLWSRSIAGILMTVGHFAFALLLWKMWRGEGKMRSRARKMGPGGPTLLAKSKEEG